MTDADRLAALLHADFMDAVPTHQRYPAPCSVCEGRAARLIAAGVTLQPAAPAEGLDACGHDVIGIRLAGYREGRAEALGDVREFVDESHDRAAAIAREYAALTPEDDR